MINGRMTLHGLVPTNPKAKRSLSLMKSLVMSDTWPKFKLYRDMLDITWNARWMAVWLENLPNGNDKMFKEALVEIADKKHDKMTKLAMFHRHFQDTVINLNRVDMYGLIGTLQFRDTKNLVNCMIDVMAVLDKTHQYYKNHPYEMPTWLYERIVYSDIGMILSETRKG